MKVKRRSLSTVSTLLIGAAIFASSYFLLTATFGNSSGAGGSIGAASTRVKRVLLHGSKGGASGVDGEGSSSDCTAELQRLRSAAALAAASKGGAAVLPILTASGTTTSVGASGSTTSSSGSGGASGSGTAAQQRYPDSDRAYHTVTTAQGFSNHWQARIHYYWFKKQREVCRATGPCDIGGFTRVLHSGKADDLMDEIPTVVVDHLPDSVLKQSSYVVLNRPFAFIEWLDKVSIPERYVLMAEADHLFLRPMPNMMAGEAQGAALFTYIVPDQYPNIIRKFTGPISDAEIKKVPKIGNSPTMVSVKELRKVAPQWYNTTIAIFEDKEAHEAWNWVLEMYGYSLATYITGGAEKMAVHSNMLAHPPFDKTELDWYGKPFYILHLTYPCKYDKFGNFTENKDDIAWQFDKRLYSETPPARNLPGPPEYVKNDLVTRIIDMMNEATAHIPCWDNYVATKKVTTVC